MKFKVGDLVRPDKDFLRTSKRLSSTQLSDSVYTVTEVGTTIFRLKGVSGLWTMEYFHLEDPATMPDSFFK